MLEHWPQGLQIDDILFPALGPIQSRKVQHLLALGAD